MRRSALAGFAFFALLGGATALNASEDGWALRGGSNFEVGLGAVAGMTGSQALYIKGAENAGLQRYYIGTLERELPAKAVQGQRVQLSVRLKSEGVASTMVTLQINKADGTGIRSPASMRWQTDSGDAWQVKQFVLDVPHDAQNLVLDINVKDKAKVWVDELSLKAVGPDVKLSSSGRTSMQRPDDWAVNEGAGGSGANTANLAPDPSAYAPLIGGSFVAGGTPVTQPGATPR
jgi:hypothetical protein